jgi:hypothetical protein
LASVADRRQHVAVFFSCQLRGLVPQKTSSQRVQSFDELVENEMTLRIYR